jgi:hypothetical protein
MHDAKSPMEEFDIAARISWCADRVGYRIEPTEILSSMHAS